MTSLILKQKLTRHLSNLPGWRTKRRIVVIESDDWGAIRMSSKKAYEKLYNSGVKPYDADEERYLRNDGLASEQDLEGLFEVLASVKDRNEKTVVFTAVGLTANPDFYKIRKSDFQSYYYEPFTETLKRYPYHSGSYKLWKEGISNGLFIPQFHGREHLNVTNWLKALQQGNKDTLLAFEQQVYGITPKNPINHVSYQAAFDIAEVSEVEYQKKVIQEGLDLFEKLFGYRANFFVPTNGPFNNSLEEQLFENKIKFISASKIQHEPIGNGQTKRHFHYLGQKNKFNQIYLTRNCFFEPSSSQKSDWIDACLSDISIAFNWNKPAVISSHRVNYIGWLNPANRDKGLFQLKELLLRILKKWPDVEFMSSDQMGEIVIKHS